MNKANECTCPSGDGSLVHPCPAHPAVEQAGTNVGHGHVFPRADGVKMRCGGPALCSECAADAYRARAALAQPSPALPPFAEKVLAKLRRFYDCAEDFESGGVDIGRHWLDLLTQLGLLNRVQRSPAFWEISQQGEDLLGMPQPSPAQAEQAEAERPEVVATMYTHHDDVDFREFVVVGNCDKGCEGFYGPEKLMTVAQHERIVKAWIERWKAYIELSAKIAAQRDAANARLHEVATACATAEQERDVAQAEVERLTGVCASLDSEKREMEHKRDAIIAMRDAAMDRVSELEKQEPVALANRGLHAFWVKWTEAAAGLYGPGIKLYAAPVVQAQHSVPEVSGIGRDFAYPRSVVLYLRTEPTDDDLRAIHDGLLSLAAAPGKEGNDD